jgi:hypothetical protein
LTPPLQKRRLRLFFATAKWQRETDVHTCDTQGQRVASSRFCAQNPDNF